jgi:signal transduction histidine kinase
MPGIFVRWTGEPVSLWRGSTSCRPRPTITATMREGRSVDTPSLTPHKGRRRLYRSLQTRMAASYVIATAAVVILVEAVAIGFIIPNLLASQDLQSRVTQTAGNLADQISLISTSADHVVLPADFVLGQPGTSLGPGQVQQSGNGLVVPQVTQHYSTGSAPLTLALVFTPDGKILASSYPSRYPIGSSAFAATPTGSAYQSGKGAEIASTPTGKVAWSMLPVQFPPAAIVYVQAPVQAATIASVSSAGPLLQGGLVLLVLTLPVGVIFGVLTTRGVVRRLRRLGTTSAKLADGDLSRRVEPGPHDEVGQLERDFNQMAERLQASVDYERSLAEKSARLAERSRISRELHDSISQDLFSLSLLAGGLDKALPPDSPLRSEVRALAQTVESANREMRALLLELRPATLEEKGLVPALDELVSTYATRLGIKVDADLVPVRMAPAAELAALRIAQEGLANAIKHAQATSIKLALHRNGSGAEIVVTDNGRGFEVSSNGATKGLGLRLMRERIEELGGSFTVQSDAGGGTVLRAILPGEAT